MKKFMAIFVTIVVVAFTVPAFAALDPFSDADPFADVPKGHWAYDAVELLASRKLISGLPEGAFKGDIPTTRYEMASIVARALATFDIENASREELKVIQDLFAEFRNEIDLLGVKADEIDSRVAKIEKGLGGWTVIGVRYLVTANFSSGDQETSSYIDSNYKNSIEKTMLRMYVLKRIENGHFFCQFRAGNYGNTSYNTAKGDIDQLPIYHVEAVAYLPWDVRLRVGRYLLNIELENMFYIDANPIFGNRCDNIELRKSFGDFDVMMMVGRNSEFFAPENSNFVDPKESITEGSGGFWLCSLDVRYRPRDEFMFGLWGTWFFEDDDMSDLGNYLGTYSTDDLHLYTYAAYFTYKFTQATMLQGIYYRQDVGESWAETADGVHHPQAWKLILSLGRVGVEHMWVAFTGLRIEYEELDNAFQNCGVSYGFENWMAAGPMMNFDSADKRGTSKMLFVYYEQALSEKWSFYIRYLYHDYDTEWLDECQEYGVALLYWLTPSVGFRFAFDECDYGANDASKYYSGRDRVLQFRTTVAF